MRFSVLIENDLERLEQGFSRYGCFMSEVFRRARLITFRWLLLSGKADRCVIDTLLCDLETAHSAEDALCRVKSNISRASVSDERLEELRATESKAIDNYHKAVAAVSVTLSRAIISVDLDDKPSIENEESEQ